MDSHMYQRTVEDMMRIWVKPEIQRRRDRGVIPPDFRLSAAQVLFPSPQDASSKQVRLNEEVRIELLVRTGKQASLGQSLTLDEIEAIESARLPDSERNCGHLTLMHLGSSWFFCFDCRYNKARALDHVRVAREFLTVAQLAIEKDSPRAGCDLLFSAAELLAKAELLTIPDPKIDSHRAISRKYSRWVKLGNAPPEPAGVLNKLQAARDAARYLKHQFRLTAEELNAAHTVLTGQADRVEELIGG